MWGQSLVGANHQLTKLDSESCIVILSNANKGWELCLGTGSSPNPPPSTPHSLIRISYQPLTSCQLLRLLDRELNSQGCALIFKFFLIHRLWLKYELLFPTPPSVAWISAHRFLPSNLLIEWTQKRIASNRTCIESVLRQHWHLPRAMWISPYQKWVLLNILYTHFHLLIFFSPLASVKLMAEAVGK